MSNGLDEILETHNDGINKGQVIELELILKAIKTHKLTEVYQVECLIGNRLEELKGEQYERDANLDYLTEQTPNV